MILFLENVFSATLKPEYSILQRFILPKTNTNVLYRNSWTNSSFSLERSINLNRIHDNQIPFHDRSMTFEGGPELSTTSMFFSFVYVNFMFLILVYN